MIRKIILLLILIISLISASNRIYLDNCYLTSSDSSISAQYSCGALPIKSIVNDTLTLNYPFTLDKSIKSPTLFLPPISYIYTIRLNGEKLYSWGFGKSNGNMANYSSRAISLPKSILKENNKITVCFHSDGTRTGINGLWIGNQLDADKYAYFRTYLNNTLIKTIGIISLIIGLILILYALIYRGKKAYTLYLGFFAISVFIAYIQFTFNAYWYDYLLFYKLSKIGAIFMSISLILIVLEITELSIHKLIKPVILFAYIPYLLSIISQSSKLSVSHSFNNVSNNLMMPILIIGLLLLIFTTFKKRSLPSILFLLSYMILITTAISDLRYLTVFQNPVFWTLPYGYMQMIIVGIIVSLYMQIQQTKSLKDKNKKLSRIIENNDLQDEIIANQVAFSTKEIIENVNAVYKESSDCISGDKMPFVGLIHYTRTLRFRLNLIFKKMEQPKVWFDSFSLISVIDSFIALYSLGEDFKVAEPSIQIKHNTLPTKVWGDENALFAIFWEIVKIEIISKHNKEMQFYFTGDGLIVEINGPLSENLIFDKEVFENSKYYLRLKKLNKHSSGKIDYSLNENNLRLAVIIPLKIVNT